MIRLDTYPRDHLAARFGTPVVSSPSTLSCLLHSGELPSSHSLSVRVGGVCQEVTREGSLLVCSWQCGRETPMEIHLMQGARLLNAWRGWWNGECTVAHTGTLALQVFCAGRLQPAGLASPPPAPTPLSVADQARDGAAVALCSPASTAVLTWPTPAEVREDPPEEAEEDEGGSGVATIPRNETGREEDEEREEREDEEPSDEEEILEQQGAPPAASFPTLIHVPDGTMVATMHADGVWSRTEHEQVMQHLAARIAQMPATAILVDLRQHTPTPRARRSPHAQPRSSTRPEKLGPTKETLRTLYGARYWDRGSEISTMRRYTAGQPPRWRRLVTLPASSEGLGALLQALEQGFSLLLLDSIRVYEESARAAVLAALRDRTVNLSLGTCS